MNNIIKIVLVVIINLLVLVTILKIIQMVKEYKKEKDKSYIKKIIALAIIGVVAFSILLYTIIDFWSSENEKKVEKAQAVEKFNSNFSSFEGTQSGYQIDTLCSRLLANAGTYANEIDKIIVFKFYSDNTNYETVSNETEGNIAEYVKGIMNIKGDIDKSHDYFVELKYNEEGYITLITVYYNHE